MQSIFTLAAIPHNDNENKLLIKLNYLDGTMYPAPSKIQLLVRLVFTPEVM
jgi:hypothetical protein